METIVKPTAIKGTRPNKLTKDNAAATCVHRSCRKRWATTINSRKGERIGILIIFKLLTFQTHTFSFKMSPDSRTPTQSAQDTILILESPCQINGSRLLKSPYTEIQLLVNEFTYYVCIAPLPSTRINLSPNT